MERMRERMKEEVKRILARDDVKCVIGYEKGSFGFRVSPSFAFTGEEVDRFVLSPLCVNNLAVYLTLEKRMDRSGARAEDNNKQAVILKGCDSRSLVQILVERGIPREDVIVIGVPCTGMVDPRKIERMFPDIGGEVEEKNDMFVVHGSDGESREVPKEELLLDKCGRCEYPNPVIHDVLPGEKVEPKSDDFGDVEAFEEKGLDERWKYWEEHFRRCIRCYACREACPLCYCEQCVADNLSPQWVRRSVDLAENAAWNLLRAFHLAGRCVGCGECERACPVNIPLMELNRKMAKDVRELFDHVPGSDVEGKPLLTLFKPDDPEGSVL